MKYDQYFPSQPFVALTVNQFVWRGGSPLEQKKRDNPVCRKTSALPLIYRKNQSSLHEQRSLGNCEKGMAFMTCNGCEDEYHK